MTPRGDFEQAMKAFVLFTLEERRAALREFASLRYPSLDDRFFEAVYRVIRSRDYLAALGADPMTNEWYPIETAPKDRDVLIVFGIRPDVTIAHWSESAALEKPELGGWLEQNGIWLHAPTHWMPFPDPPLPALEPKL